jgi:hypothetical protein
MGNITLIATRGKIMLLCGSPRQVSKGFYKNVPLVVQSSFIVAKLLFLTCNTLVFPFGCIRLNYV